MKLHTAYKSISLVTLVLLLLSLLAAPSASAGVVKRYEQARGQQDLLLLGFGELTLHMLSVSGNVKAFEDGNPHLKDDFAANYRLSLFADGNINRSFFINGTAVIDSKIDDEYRTADPSVFRLKMSAESTEPIWDSWRFTGQLRYDPQRIWDYENLDIRLLTHPQREAQLELLARLESEEYGYLEGGSLHPSFKNSTFTLHRRSLFGGFSDLNLNPVGIEMVGGKLEGRRIREGDVVGIRADGTSGPYELDFAPVIRGSEEVKIEVRDRLDVTTVLSSETLKRDIDYTVDYDRGRILLNLPVSSETAEANPVFIVISYDFERDENDALVGSRVSLGPNKNITGGVSYLHRFINDNSGAAGIEEPEDLGAVDFAFNYEQIGGYFEIARSDDEISDENSQAIRAGIKASPIYNLNLNAKYLRIDDDFQSFTNTDLNPNKNQERIELAGEYELTRHHRFTAAFNNYSILEANGDFNSYNGDRDEKIYRIGYTNRSRHHILNFSLERRDVKDENDLGHEDNTLDRLIAEYQGFDGDFGLLGKIGYKVHYEHLSFNNKAALGADDNNRNLITAGFSTRPSNSIKFELTQKLSIRRNTVQEIYDEREDATFAKLHLRPLEYWKILGTAEYKRFTVPGAELELWQDEPRRLVHSYTLASELLPLKYIKMLGKFGRHQNEQWTPDSTYKNVSDFILGQLTWFPEHHMSFGLETEFKQTYYESTEWRVKRLWDLGLKYNWNRDRFNEFTAGLIRRYQSDDYSTSEEIVSSSSYLVLISGSLGLFDGLYLRYAVKGIVLDDPIDDTKDHLLFEIGYEGANWYRISVGYERIENETEKENVDLAYYRGHGMFLRLVGKF